MKRQIDGVVYDTAQAAVMATFERGSTHVHRAISLYRSADGRYFLVEEREIHGVDGALLTPLSDGAAREWLEHHGRGELAATLFAEGARSVLRVDIEGALAQRIGAAAAAAGLSEQAWIAQVIEAVLAGAGHAAAETGRERSTDC